MRIVILVGSGLSIPANYPSTGDITGTVMAGAGSRHTDSTYYLGGSGDPDGVAAVAMIRRFLVRLASVVNDYYPAALGRGANYEDLAYVAGQLADSASGDYDNPALGPLHDALRGDIDTIIRESPLSIVPWDPYVLAMETRNYVGDIVWRSLAQDRDANYLGDFVEFVGDRRLADVSIFTLNHDTLLERTLRAARLEFEDGFGDAVNNVRYWQPDRLSADLRTRRLVKLHGSVDWFVLRPDGGQFHEERIAQVSGDYEHTRDASGRLQFPVESRPLLLIGTHNKPRGYLNPPHFDTHIEFYRRLNHATALVVVGYGGQDKAVNERIVDWMEADVSRRLVFVDRSARIIDQARGALRGIDSKWVSKGFPRWRRQGRFELIARPIQDVCAADYLAALGS